MSLPETILPPIAKALAAKGYETLTEVQRAMLEPEADGRDLLVSAQTGSGKTVAFGIAIAPTLLAGETNLGKPAAPLALVIAPTRELALQVQRELDWLYAEAGGKTASCVGGMDPRAERRSLDAGAHIVVGTPGRLRDHITRGALDLSGLQAVVLDEADEMLDLGFREDLEFILSEAPEERRTLLFSATVPRPIAQLARTFQNDALRVSAATSSEQHADIEYKLILVPTAERENAIINTLLYFDSASAIVFCSTRESVKHLSARLHNRGFSVVTLSGELTQQERTNALQAMRDGRARICVATDVAARGIDLPNLDLVIHAELATNADVLLHRSGRTGRAGRKGTCALIVPLHRKPVALRLLKTARLDVEYMAPPTVGAIEARYRQSILEAVDTAEPGPEAAELAAEILARHGAQAVANAYVRQQMAMRPAPEDVTESPQPDKPGDSDPREKSRFEEGVWFTVSLGRKHRAEPRWLLPLLCNAGGITKKSLGSIRIGDSETLFEVAAGDADAFEAHIAEHGTGERQVSIARQGSAAIVQTRPGKPAKPRKDDSTKAPRPAARTYDPSRADDKPRKPGKTFEAKKPYEARKPYEGKAAAEPAGAAKVKSKDKGKPKWSKTAPEGAPRGKKDHKTPRKPQF